MPNKVIVQNLYRTTITSAAAIPASGDFQFDVAVAPNQKNGFLILGSENIATRQIVYYHDVVGVTVYVRGINRITAAAIASPTGYSVKMNDVAEIFNYFGDNISTLFYIEKMGGLSAKVWGGYLMYNNNQVLVADTTLTLTDSTTNYVKYDPVTNTISSNTVASGNIKCEIVCSGGAITSILYRTSKESYLDFAISITGALPSQVGNAGKSLITDGTNVSWGISNFLRSLLQSNATTDGLLIAGKTKLPIINGDFAIGSGTTSVAAWIGAKVNGWYASGAGTWTAAYDTGRLKLQTTAVASFVEGRTTDGGYNGVVDTSIPVEPNTTYTVDFDMQTAYISGSSIGGAKVVALCSTTVGGAGVSGSSTGITTTTGNTHYSFTFTTGANDVYVNISPIIYGHTGTGTLIMDAWFDNIVVTCPSKELLKTVTPTSVIASTDKLLMEKQDGSFAKAKVSDFQGALGLSVQASAYEAGIVAGDPVGLIQDALYKIQAENTTSNSSSTPTEVLQTEKLSATTYAVCYQTGGTLFAIICTVSGDTVTFGSAQTIGSAGSAVNGGMARIGAAKLAFAYIDTAAAFPNHTVFGVVGTVSGTTISLGSAVTIQTITTGGTWNCYLQGMCRIRDDAFAFNTYDQTGAGGAYGCTVSGTVPSAASTLIGTSSNIPMVWLADNRIALTWGTAMRMLEINPASLVVTTTYTGTVGNTFNTIARLSDTSFVAGGYSAITDANIYFFEKPGAGTVLTQNSIGTLSAINQQLIPIYDGVFGVHTGGSIIVMDGKQVLWTIAGVSAMPSTKTFPVYINGRLFYHSLTSLQSRIVRLARAFYAGIATDSVGGFKARFSLVSKSGVVFPYVYYLQANGTIDRVMYTTGATRIGKAMANNILLLE